MLEGVEWRKSFKEKTTTTILGSEKGRLFAYDRELFCKILAYKAKSLFSVRARRSNLKCLILN